MKTLHRNKKPIYICEVYEENKLRKYKEPVYLRENWAQIKPSAEFMGIGLDSYNYLRIKTSIDHAKYYHIGDRAYVFVTPPSVHDPICKEADYEVCKDPIVMINEVEIIFKRLSGRNNNSVF